MKPFISWLLLALFSFTIPTFAADKRPFNKGEVAVYASPQQLKDYKIKKHLANSGITVLEVLSGKEWGLIQKLRAKGKKAGLNFIAHKSINDPLISYQWHFQKVQAFEAWGITTGTGVSVAVLDTGLTPNGNDGVNICATPGYDMVNNDNAPFDGDGHGTHVSGTISQITNNGVGAAGLAYGACVMPIKVLNDSGSGSFADIADGIYYAVNNGAKVINMSLGVNAKYGVTSDPIMDSALDYAYNNGVTVVAAAGNDGHRKNVSYPAIYPTTIAVGATDYRDRVTRYSNKGKGLDMMAPGGDLGRDDNGDGYGDGVLQETIISGSWGYYFFHGTSMASPHVAAAAAMLIANSNNGTLNPDQLKTRLFDYAKDLGDNGYDNQYGHGLLQVHSSLLQSGGVTPPPPTSEDADGDGYTVAQGDCNDNNAAVHPGANDTRGKKGRDGIDNNCNGIIDG